MNFYEKRKALFDQGLGICTNCKETKTIDKFTRDSRSKYGFRTRCKECLKSQSKKIAETDREKSRDSSRRGHIKKKYNLTLEEYQQKLIDQEYQCYICKDSISLKWMNFSEEKTKDAHLDHNHSTGKIRKFLCYRCNIGIGYLREDIGILKSAIDYLKEFGE